MMLIAAAAAMLATGAHKDAYIISTGQNMTFNTGTSINEFTALNRRLGSGPYVWVRRGGREYLITDETTVLRAVALFAPEMRLSPEASALGREEARLDKEADRIEDKDDRTAAEEQRLEELHARLRAIALREKELDENQEALEREAERALWILVDSAVRAGTAKPLAR
jgi:hypothetical protein